VSLPVTITVQVPGPLRKECKGSAELSLTAATVGAVLTEVERLYPALYRCVCDETGTVRRHINVFVNANHMRDCDGLDTRLASGDSVIFLPAVSGG
jgi:sulfur-carrier protein